ncbi:MAG: ThuA domain-containing protein [Planctomycetota bacterium]|nr:ThuA domain-containing protein [Planctomycetota bacterium]
MTPRATLMLWLLAGCLLLGGQAAPAADDAPAGKKLKVAVLTGGHGFDHKTFFELFKSFPDITYDEIVLKKDLSCFDDISQWSYDVIVMYNMTQEITDKQKENFLKLLDKSVGLVPMHHSLGGHANWPEYQKIIGGRFYLTKTMVDGEPMASTYAEGVEYTIHVEDANHPVTAGVKDFKVHDEVYAKCAVEPDNKVLLTTDNAKSDKELVWVRKYRNSNVCFIMPGHGTTIFSNEDYRRLVHNAIFWTAGK